MVGKTVHLFSLILICHWTKPSALISQHCNLLILKECIYLIIMKLLPIWITFIWSEYPVECACGLSTCPVVKLHSKPDTTPTLPQPQAKWVDNYLYFISSQPACTYPFMFENMFAVFLFVKSICCNAMASHWGCNYFSRYIFFCHSALSWEFNPMYAIIALQKHGFKQSIVLDCDHLHLWLILYSH